jgi:hypothetical protein
LTRGLFCFGADFRAFGASYEVYPITLKYFLAYI